MAEATAEKKVSAREAAIKVLRKHGEPMQLAEIVKEALKLATNLGGKDPGHAIRVQVVVGSNKGKSFKRVGRGTYALLDQADPEPVKKLDEPKAEKPKVEKPKVEDAIEADLKRGTAKVKAKGKDEVTPDPKPTKQPKQSRRAKATA